MKKELEQSKELTKNGTKSKRKDCCNANEMMLQKLDLVLKEEVKILQIMH